ncbi:MAG: 30S ribosomal protein S17 [Candidatus Pacearchaeota archaeon]
MAKKNDRTEREKGKNVARAMILPRGRKFEGYVIRKFDKRVTIQFEKVRFIRKYERYIKKKIKLHAHLPDDMKNEINIGDYIEIQECRPLSKIKHHIIIRKIREGEKKNESD